MEFRHSLLPISSTLEQSRRAHPYPEVIARTPCGAADGILRVGGPSTPPFRSLRERNSCAQDDSLCWFASLDSLESFIQGNHSRAKSSQCGFSDSISAIFFDRRQPLSCFSLAIARWTSLNDSRYNRRST